MSEIEQLQRAIEALESQRAVLGDAVVDTALAPLREKQRALQPAPTAEQRKLVTVMFADLVDFTAMSEHMDPEDVREVVNAYFNLWTDAIQRYRGQIEKFIGDAVMAVFGLNASQEDDPENAVRAALEIRQSLGALNAQLEQSYHIQLAMRVGIHTGPVVVSFLGERKGQDFVVVGDTVNMASRLQTAAAPGGILISHDIYRHVRGVFDLESLPAVKVKGKQAAIEVYQVQQARPRAFRLGTRGVEGVETRMIGREVEFKQLKDAFTAALNGQRQFAMVIGDVGLGKSRLLYELDSWLESLPQVVYYFKGRAHPSTQNLPYALIRDVFASRFKIQDSDLPELVRQKMETGAVQAMPDEPERAIRGAHLVAHLIGYEIGPSLYLPSGPVNVRQLRDRALAALIEFFNALSARNPVVILLEDIHWADDSSLDVIEYLAAESSGLRLLLLCAARPTLLENRPSWGQKVDHLRIDLQPLSRRNSRRLVAEILRKVKDLPEGLRALLIDHTEGNPFYMEELVKMLLEDGVIRKGNVHWQVDTSRLQAVQVPPTLAGVLQARFDSLPSQVRLYLQYASVVGRTFWDEAVAYVEAPLEQAARAAGTQPDSRRAAWDHLSSREIIQRSLEPVFKGTTEYQFKHAMVRDVTYESVLKRERRVYHARSARWLEAVTQVSQRTEEYAALIADHYERAGEMEAARSWYARAGAQAASHYAHPEAVRCLTRALELTPQEDLKERFRLVVLRAKMLNLPGNREDQKRDVALLSELANRLDDDAYRADAALQRARLDDVLGDLTLAADEARHAVDLAQAAGRPDLEAAAGLALGNVLWRMGDFSGARPPLENAQRLAQQTGDVRAEADVLRSLGVLAEAANDNPTARQFFERALALILQIGDRRGESMVYNSLGIIAYNQNDFTNARRWLSQSLKIKRDIGDRFGEASTLNNLGLLEMRRGEYAAAYRHFEQVLGISRAIEDEEGEWLATGSLASILVFLGDYDRAREPLEKATRALAAIGDRQAECEGLAIMSLLNHYTGDHQAALDFAQQSFSLSPEYGAHFEQVRSTYALGEALLAVGRSVEAVKVYRELAEIEWNEGQESQHIEILAALARAYFLNGEDRTAAGVVDQALAWFEHHTLIEGADQPFRAYLSCYEILRAKEDSRAAGLLEQTVRLLHAQAEKIDDEHLRQCYLENVPHHRQLLHASEHWTASAPLSRAAPGGRTNP